MIERFTVDVDRQVRKAMELSAGDTGEIILTLQQNGVDLAIPTWSHAVLYHTVTGDVPALSVPIVGAVVSMPIDQALTMVPSPDFTYQIRLENNPDDYHTVLTGRMAVHWSPAAGGNADTKWLSTAQDYRDQVAAIEAALTGLGNAATKNVGTEPGTVAAGDHDHQAAEISGLGNVATLSLGTVAGTVAEGHRGKTTGEQAKLDHLPTDTNQAIADLVNQIAQHGHTTLTRDTSPVVKIAYEGAPSDSAVTAEFTNNGQVNLRFNNLASLVVWTMGVGASGSSLFLSLDGSGGKEFELFSDRVQLSGNLRLKPAGASGAVEIKQSTAHPANVLTYHQIHGLAGSELLYVRLPGGALHTINTTPVV